MFLREVHIKNLKLLKDLELSFTAPDGSPRMWTLIIGENGTGKTAILQAIAMAAAGGRYLSRLVDFPSSLRDKRNERAEVGISARFVLDGRLSQWRSYPGLNPKPSGDVEIVSQVNLPYRKDLAGTSEYVSPRSDFPDPLSAARAEQDNKLWFVAAYGVHRMLPADPQRTPPLERPGVDRLLSLFQPIPPISTAFASILPERKARLYSKILGQVLFQEEELLPRLSKLELRGQGGVRSARDLQERHRFHQMVAAGQQPMKLPASWLSHGYQSTIAWLADLVGHILWEARVDESVEAEDMEGLVLIDEIDLYLHPRWQVSLVRSLKKTFPRIQFVATTHSPVPLAGLRPDRDEIVRLGFHEKSGDVCVIDMRQGRPLEPDPRLMTSTELHRVFFGIEHLYPAHIGNLLREYRYLAADPFRNDEDEHRLDKLQDELRRESVQADFDREPRSAS